MKIPQFVTIGVVIALFASFGAGLGVASAGTQVTPEPARFKLVSAIAGTEGQESVRLGLQIELEPGWKTYWRSPGDAGIAPGFIWNGSQNLRAASILWPTPTYFESFGLGSWGYSNEIVFPIDVELETKGAPLELMLQLHLGLCKDVCIPFQRDLQLTVAAGPPTETPEAALIASYAGRVPEEAGTVEAIADEITAAAMGPRAFTLTVTSRQALRAPEIIIEGKAGSYFAATPEGALAATQRRYHVAADLPGKSDRLIGQEITVTVIDGERAAEKKLRIE